MPTPPQTITLTPASTPAAPSNITLSPASTPSAPDGIQKLPHMSAVIVSGTLSPDVTGTYVQNGTVGGKRAYYRQPSADVSLTWDVSFPGWVLGDAMGDYWFSSDNVATPDLVGTWSENGSASGTPTVTLVGTIDAPSNITLSPASTPSAPSNITLSPASTPSAPSTISMTPASVPDPPGEIVP